MQRLRDAPQDLVADLMAEAIVDALEVVEVDEQDRERALAALGGGEVQVEDLLAVFPAQRPRDAVARRLLRDIDEKLQLAHAGQRSDARDER